MTIKEIRQYTGLTQAEFARRYGIPKRTVENWEAGTRACPEYTVRLLAYAVGMIKTPEGEE